MKRFTLAAALLAVAACSKPADQQKTQMMADTSHMMAADTSKMMMADSSKHMMAPDTSKKMAAPMKPAPKKKKA